jgi:hypothetical protein
MKIRPADRAESRADDNAGAVSRSIYNQVVWKTWLLHRVRICRTRIGIVVATRYSCIFFEIR